jgi:hypothetical protein
MTVKDSGHQVPSQVLRRQMKQRPIDGRRRHQLDAPLAFWAKIFWRRSDAGSDLL